MRDEISESDGSQNIREFELCHIAYPCSYGELVLNCSDRFIGSHRWGVKKSIRSYGVLLGMLEVCIVIT